MPLLNAANAIMLGETPATKVYAGDAEVWPPYATISFTGASGWAGYGNNYINGPSSYAPGDVQVLCLYGVRDNDAANTLDELKNGTYSIPPEVKNWRQWRSGGDLGMRVYWGVTDGTKRLRIDLEDTGDTKTLNWLSVSGVDPDNPFGSWSANMFMTSRGRGVVKGTRLPMEGAIHVCTQHKGLYDTFSGMERDPSEIHHWSNDDPPYSDGYDVGPVVKQASTTFASINNRQGGHITFTGTGSPDDPIGWFSAYWKTSNHLYGMAGAAFSLRPGRLY